MSSKQSNNAVRRPRWRAGGWVIGAVVGIAVGFGLAVATQDWQEAREASDIERRAEMFGREDVVPPPVDAVRSLIEQDGLVAVDPLMVDRVPEADRQRAEEILARSPVPARIAYVAYPDSSDVGYTTTGAAAMWQAAIGEEGFYVVLFDNGLTETGALGLEDHYVSTQTKGQPGPALVRLAEEMVTWEAEPLPTAAEAPHDNDYWGGIGGGIGAAVLFGALGVVPAFLLLRWYVGSRRRKDT
jgi:hypothetical protein